MLNQNRVWTGAYLIKAGYGHGFFVKCHIEYHGVKHYTLVRSKGMVTPLCISLFISDLNFFR